MNRKILGILVCMLTIAITVPTTFGNNSVYLNNPPVADAGGPYQGEEGLEMFFDASGSFDPDGDDLSYRWDFDGDEIWDTDWTTDPIYFYTYGDDYDFSVFVEVSDGLASSYASSPCLIFNVDPEADAGEDQTVNEGDTVLLVNDFTDVGFDDKHVICWDFDMNDSKQGNIVPPRFVPGPGFEWEDGSGARTMVINLTTNSFKVNDFRWKVESGTMHVIYFPGSKWSIDEQTSGTYFEGKTVDYPFCRPVWTTDSFTVSMEPDANGKFKMVFTITLNGEPINKGVIEFDTNEGLKNSWITEVIFGDDGTYDLWFYVTDDDGGTDEDEVLIEVYNGPPIVEPFGPFEGMPDIPIEMSGTATDAGSDDLTFTWDFGDGLYSEPKTYYNNGKDPDPGNGSCNGTAPFTKTDTVTHTYENRGNYILKLTVEDDNGGISYYTTNVNIPKSKSAYGPFIKILQNHPYLFSIIQLLLQRLKLLNLG